MPSLFAVTLFFLFYTIFSFPGVRHTIFPVVVSARYLKDYTNSILTIIYIHRQSRRSVFT